ncbi:MAG TPA: hypothetical protein VGJ21_10020 [Terracidiphilus sp.]
MDDWADSALKRLESQRINKRRQQDEFLERQRIKKAHGFPLWLEIREIVKAHCATFNTKAAEPLLTFAVSPNIELEVKAEIDGDRRILHASFDEATGKLRWSCASNGGLLTIDATPGGTAQFLGEDGPVNKELLASRMLNALVLG